MGINTVMQKSMNISIAMQQNHSKTQCLKTIIIIIITIILFSFTISVRNLEELNKEALAEQLLAPDLRSSG